MSGNLPTWLADWLGVDVVAGDGATWRLDSAWPWAPWVTLLLVLLVITWTVTLYVREGGSAGRRYRGLLIALRLAALGTLLVMLAQWTLTVRVTGPPAVALLIDRSASMEIADRYDDSDLAERMRERLQAAGLGDPTRLNLAKLLVGEEDGSAAGGLAELAARYRLEVYFVADGIERLPSTEDAAEVIRAVRALSTDGAGSQATRLGDAVRHVLSEHRGTPPGAILLLTDGVTTAGAPLSAAARDARRKGVPLMAVGLGSDQPPPDIELADVLVDEAVFAGDPVRFQVQIKASGLEGQPARVILRRADGEIEETVPALAEETVALPPGDETRTVTLLDRPADVGEVAYVIEVAPREDEIDQENNRQRRVVTVRDEKVRVLLAYGYPHYEFRFLKSVLERDSTIELATYLQDAEPDYAEQDKTALRQFPITQDELFRYDVLVFGDVDPSAGSGLPRSVWQHVRSFVTDRGGGAAFIAGPRYLPWRFRDNPDVAALLPVVLSGGGAQVGGDERFTVLPTALGLASPPLQLADTPAQTEQIWKLFGPLYWRAEFRQLKPAAQVLAEVDPPSGIPVIVFQYVGGGRVLFHAVDSTWRWRQGVDDAYFARYWVQMLRYLARGKLTGGRGVRLASDRREYRAGGAVQVRARFLDPRLAPETERVTLAVESEGQPRREITLRRNPAADGVFEGTLTDLPEGQYQVLLIEPRLSGGPPTARFNVITPLGELARPEMDRAALVAAAEATGGKFYTVADAGRLATDLAATATRRVPLEDLPPVSLTSRWWLLALFLACITSEWILRKRKGVL